MRACLEKGNVRGAQFFAGVALVRCLSLSPRSALREAILAQIKTSVGIAPNQQMTTAAFARRLADNALMEPIKQLPIFREATEIGRTFPLAEIDVAIPIEDLGVPWNQTPLRKDPPNHGIREY
jgi:hypothetical protein